MEHIKDLQTNFLRADAISNTITEYLAQIETNVNRQINAYLFELTCSTVGDIKKLKVGDSLYSSSTATAPLGKIASINYATSTFQLNTTQFSASDVGQIKRLYYKRSSKDSGIHLDAPIIIGQHNNSISQNALINGTGNLVFSNDSHAEGAYTTASGNASHSEGIGTIASGESSHAEGAGTTASSPESHAEGTGTVASGDYSHAESYNTEASGFASHAEGINTIASGLSSHAEGNGTTASGTQSHTEGWNTEATADSAHAEGVHTTASGAYSHSEGYYTTVSGSYAHAEGYYTQALGAAQHVSGKYNVADSTRFAFIIGNGTNTNSRHNAFAITWKGELVLWDSSNNEVVLTANNLRDLIASLPTT